MTDGAEEVRLEVPSQWEFLSVINDAADAVAEIMGFGQEARDHIATAVVEAGTNVIQHGHREDGSRKTKVLFQRGADRLTIVVRDDGPGFDPTKLSDPVAEENLLAQSGRGIHILRAFMDEVEFRFPEGATGTECHLVKYLPR